MTKAMYTFTQPYKPVFKTWSHRNANKLNFSLNMMFAIKYILKGSVETHILNYLYIGHQDILTVNLR